MSRSHQADSGPDVRDLARKNPNVDLKKVLEAEEMLRRLCDEGVSEQGYDLAPPFRRQMYVESKHRGGVTK